MIQVLECMRVLVFRAMCIGGLSAVTLTSVWAQWGWCASDVAANQFTAVRMVAGEENASTVWRASYAFGKESMSTSELGWFYDSSGTWQPVSGDLDLSWRGVGLEFAYRKAYEPESRPFNGFFAGIHASLRHVVSACSEVAMADGAIPAQVYGAYGQAPATHVMNATIMGVGLELGWALATERRVALEFFVAPIFQGVTRFYRETDSKWNSEEALDAGMVNRLRASYAPRSVARGIYLRQTGPWLRFGTVLYMNPQLTPKN